MFFHLKTNCAIHSSVMYGPDPEVFKYAAQLSHSLVIAMWVNTLDSAEI